MNKAIIATVRDRNGNTVERAEGEFQDGDVILQGSAGRVGMMMVDRVSRVQDSSKRIFLNDTPHRGGVHTVAMRVLGDAYNIADYAGLSDEAIRHAVVKRKLGSAADGRSASFLDAAWQTFAGGSGGASTSAPPAASHGMSDSQRSVAALGVEAALADAAARRGGLVRDGVRQFQAQDRAVTVRAHDEMVSRVKDGWKTIEQRAADAGFAADVTANPVSDPRMLASRAYDDMCRRMSDGWKRHTVAGGR